MANACKSCGWNLDDVGKCGHCGSSWLDLASAPLTESDSAQASPKAPEPETTKQLPPADEDLKRSRDGSGGDWPL